MAASLILACAATSREVSTMNPALLTLAFVLLFSQDPSTNQGNPAAVAPSELQLEARNNANPVLHPVEPIELANGQGSLIQFRVSVFNSSPISSSTIKRAEGEAGRVLRDAGVKPIWLNCPQEISQEASVGRCSELSFPSHLRLQILRVSQGLKVSTVGISFTAEDGQGTYANIFYEPIKQLEKEMLISPYIILGHAMAHELGHLLLGANSHSPSGLMRAQWTPEDLMRASHEDLRFSKEQCLRIRSRLTKSKYGDVAPVGTD
jgi:hypothetical protein